MTRPLVYGASWIWSSVNRVVRSATQLGLAPRSALSAKVISVGNLQAGGTGKTPLVAQIAGEAHDRGLTVCILIRGYGGQWEQHGGLIFPGDFVSTTQCGDEAALLHHLCPFAFLAVGKDRVAQFHKLSRRVERPIDIVVLDDGFQNFKIKKDIEIVTLTSARWGERVFRDFPQALKRAQVLVWTKGDRQPDGWEEFEGANPPKWRVRTCYTLSPPKNKDQKFQLICGVADGKSVKTLAVSAGYKIQNHLELQDHYSYKLPEVQEWLRDASRVGLRILLTGKDWVKWKELGIQESEVDVIEPKIQITSGQKEWREVLWSGL